MRPHPRHTPVGRCRFCGYPMDPGRCPECGTECPDVAPRVWTARDFRPYLAVLLAWCVPLAAAAVCAVVFRVGLDARIEGMAGDDRRVWATADAMAGLTCRLYVGCAPLAMVGTVGAAVLWSVRRRTRNPELRTWGDEATLALTGLIGGVVAWLVGFAYLAGMVWEL